ncbi:MAG: hypothetical protein U0133_22490 [Gemmatimonadales bacterium]
MPPTTLGPSLPAWDALPFPVLAGTAAALVVLLAWLLIRRHLLHPGVRALLHPLGSGTHEVACCLRGMFVPGNELFSRAPADPRQPTEGLTVHKWSKVPEVHHAQDVLALNEVQQLLLASNRKIHLRVVSGEPSRQGWSEPTIAIGPHFKATQILDACEPRLIQVRQPAAFRATTGEVYEAKEQLDFGLIYKGRHAATHQPFWVILGLGDQGTAAAAHFFRTQARKLGALTGRGGFAAVIAVDPSRGWEASALRAVHPKPAWWRRLVYRKTWQALTTNPWSPDAVPRVAGPAPAAAGYQGGGIAPRPAAPGSR